MTYFLTKYLSYEFSLLLGVPKVLQVLATISGDFDERQFDDGQFDEFKFDPLQIWQKVKFGQINLKKSTI